MGQRSQIYVRFNQKHNPGGKYLVARYFQWCFGDRMVSRARYIMDWAGGTRKYLEVYDGYGKGYIKLLEKVIDTNFDYKVVSLSIDLIEDYYCNTYEKFEEIFTGQDNSDGQLLIDVTKEGIKYAFVSNLAYSTEPMNPRQYMIWDNSVTALLICHSPNTIRCHRVRDRYMASIA